MEDFLNEHLTWVDGKQVIVSKSTGKPLRYYKGQGKPSQKWVEDQEKSIQYFKHLNESKVIRLYEKAGSEDLEQSMTHLVDQMQIAYASSWSAHQNVKAGTFVEGHELFKDTYELLADLIDDVAESMRSVEFVAPTSFPAVTFSPLSSAQELSKQLHPLIENVIQALYDVNDISEKENQVGVSNLIQGSITELEKLAQKIKSEAGV